VKLCIYFACKNSKYLGLTQNICGKKTRKSIDLLFSLQSIFFFHHVPLGAPYTTKKLEKKKTKTRKSLISAVLFSEKDLAK